jgi:pimeloyl-ACP methyl ester carboxylesterase
LRLRLFHARDGARIAYREAGTGPGLVLLHSALLSHKEWEPAVEHLTHRFRVILPDLPLHGDSEDRPRHPYTLDWYAEVISAFCWETATRRMSPSRLVLMPNALHRPPSDGRRRALWRTAARAAAVPGLDRVLSHAARAVFRPEFGMRLSARGNPAARDLLRHAFQDVGGNANLARAWARYAKRWPAGPQRDLLDAYAHLDLPVLLLWADEDVHHPLASAEEALDLLPQAQLRVLSGTGYLIAYDDPVGVARELVAFCG